MERIKAILKKICLLPPLQTVLIAVPSFTLVSYILVSGIDGPLAYLSYIASAYGLIVVLTQNLRISTGLKQSIILGCGT